METRSPHPSFRSVAQPAIGRNDSSLARLLVLVMLLCGPLCRGAAEGVQPPPRPLVFGVYTHIRSTAMHRKMAPLQAYLQQALSARGQAAEVKLRIFPSYSSAIDALATGQADFVRFGPVSYVLAKERNPGIRLLGMENNRSSRTFNGVISVPKDSPIRTVADLRGKRIAFGDRRSTTGRYLAQAALLRAGISAQDLAGYSYLGRHDKVAFAVAAGHYDAGATNENTFNRYATEKGLRKILEFPCVTKPWVAREGLDQSLFTALQDALLTLDDPEALEQIARDGLMPANDADYEPIRRAMDEASRFDPLSLNFGIYAAIKPSDAYNQVRPIIASLERELTAAGSLSSVRIRVFRDYRQTIDALVRGDIDFARLGSASFHLAREANPRIQALARERAAGGPPAGVFVVRADSNLNSIDQLVGHRLAFGNRDSTEGRYLAQAALLDAGIGATDLGGFAYLGRHDQVAHAVTKDIYDAGVLRETALAQQADALSLRVIGRFESAHKIWAARAGLAPEQVADIRQALFDIPKGPNLAPLRIDGFAPIDINDATYAWVDRRIEKARQFDPNR